MDMLIPPLSMILTKLITCTQYPPGKRTHLSSMEETRPKCEIARGAMLIISYQVLQVMSREDPDLYVESFLWTQ